MNIFITMKAFSAYLSYSSGKMLFSDPVGSINLVISFVILAGTWMVLLLSNNGFAEQVPLHYNIFFGIDLYGPWYQAYWLPIFGSATYLVNLLFAIFVYRKERILAYYLIGTSTFVQLINAIAVVFILSIN